MLDAFGGPASIQVHLSWAPSEEEAMRIAHDQWRTNVFSPPLCWDLATVEQFDEAAKHVRPEDVRPAVPISSDLAQHAEWMSEYAELGFDAIYLHHVGKEQRPFIEAFGDTSSHACEAQGHQRSVVEERRRLLRRRRDVPRLRRRRLRRPGGLIERIDYLAGMGVRACG